MRECPAAVFSSICSVGGSLDDSEPDDLVEERGEENEDECTGNISIVVMFAGDGSADDSELEDDDDCDKGGLVS